MVWCCCAPPGREGKVSNDQSAPTAPARTLTAELSHCEDTNFGNGPPRTRGLTGMRLQPFLLGDVRPRVRGLTGFSQLLARPYMVRPARAGIDLWFLPSESLGEFAPRARGLTAKVRHLRLLLCVRPA